MAKRRDRFVVGLTEGREEQTIYGEEEMGDWVEPCRAGRVLEVRRVVRMYSKGRITTYRLVPVPVAEVERQAARERKARKGKR